MKDTEEMRNVSVKARMENLRERGCVCMCVRVCMGKLQSTD